MGRDMQQAAKGFANGRQTMPTVSFYHEGAKTPRTATADFYHEVLKDTKKAGIVCGVNYIGLSPVIRDLQNKKER